MCATQYLWVINKKGDKLLIMEFLIGSSNLEQVPLKAVEMDRHQGYIYYSAN